MSSGVEKVTEDSENLACKRMKFEHNSDDAETIGCEKESSSTLSKKQRKRLEKRAAYEKWKVQKRAKEKEKMRQKRLHAKLNNISLGPSRKLLKNTTMAQSTCKIHVVIDLSFDDYMNSKELSHCIKQILRCYSLNRRAKNPMQLHVTSFNGMSKEEMSKHSGYTNWDLFFHEESYLDVFKKEDVTYLTSESENVVKTLENDRAYIIGGLVDYNAQKGLCHSLAVVNEVNHGQLPIGEYIEMKTRKVLTIDHVFEILVQVSEGHSWEEAFLKVLPSRKGATHKETEDCSAESVVIDDHSLSHEESAQTGQPEVEVVADTTSELKEETLKESTEPKKNILVEDNSSVVHSTQMENTVQSDTLPSESTSLAANAEQEESIVATEDPAVTCEKSV